MPAQRYMPSGLQMLASADHRLHRALDLCRKALNTNLPVLILGETGTGKDTLARALHARSQRSNKKFIAINCAAIPDSLLASELFGYAPGTFTGAHKNGYAGKLISGNGGTVFLDEIGDMPLELQAYLLRILDERAVTPLGSNTSIELDVQFISATHQNLESMVARGRFRMDLFFRIRGTSVRLPPLRERTDLVDLVKMILEQEAYDQKLGDVPDICPSMMQVLMRYDWPGNMRELRSIIRLMLALTGTQHMTLSDLPSPLLEFAHSQFDGQQCCCKFERGR